MLEDSPPVRRSRILRAVARPGVVHLLAAVILPALALLLYRRALHGPLIFDDPNTLTNGSVQRLFPLLHFLHSNRPLSDLSLALNQLRAGMQPYAYHVTSLVLHMLNGLLLYVLFARTLRLPALAPRYGDSAPVVALAAAALFIAHPLQTESVAYISSRSEVLVAFFYLLTMWLYVGAATASGGARAGYAVALPLAATAALASKESAATLPVALVLYDWCFLARGSVRRLAARWWLLALPMLPIAAGAAYLLHRPMLVVSGAGFGMTIFTPWEYLLTQLGVIVHYLHLTLLPVGLCFDTDWPVAHSPWTAAVLLPALLLAALLVTAFLSLRRRPLYAFAILWMFLTLAPTSSILPLADPVAEHRMYLPLAGLALLAAAWLWDASVWIARRLRAARGLRATAYALLIAVPLASLSVLTARRAALWADPLALHTHDVAEAPNNPRLWMNLGVIYLSLDRIDDAYAALTRAAHLFQQHRSPHAIPRVGSFIAYNLGVVLYGKGDYAASATELTKALVLGKAYKAMAPRALFLLGEIASRRHEWHVAATQYRAALFHDPTDQGSYYGLARAYVMTGDLAHAAATLHTALRYDPHNQNAAALLKRIEAAERAKQ